MSLALTMANKVILSIWYRQTYTSCLVTAKNGLIQFELCTHCVCVQEVAVVCVVQWNISRRIVQSTRLQVSLSFLPVLRPQISHFFLAPVALYNSLIIFYVIFGQTGFVVLFMFAYSLTHLSCSSLFPANSMTVGWLSNNMSADYEDVHVPMKKAPPKQTKVVVF